MREERTVEAGPAAGMPSAERPFGRCRRWVGGFLTAFLHTFIGTMLVLLPWLPSWDQNYFSGKSPDWYAIWMNPYFRGSVSGIGVVNLYVSFLELLGLLRGLRR